MIDFISQEKRAQRQTRWLLVLFGLAALATVLLVYLVLGVFLLAYYKPLPHHSVTYGSGFTALLMLGEGVLTWPEFFHWLWEPKMAVGIAVGTLSAIAVGSLYKIMSLAEGGPAVAKLLGGRRVDPNTGDLERRTLCHIVQEMAIASQMPAPEVFVLERELGINSFAAGHGREDVAIGVSLGCLKLLSRDELQGVIAHEFSHILNGDTRFNMRLMGLAHGLLWPRIVGRVLLRGTSDDPQDDETLLGNDANSIRNIFLPIALPLLFIGALTSPSIRLIKSLICREREWLADAYAVQFTRNREGIEGALKKVGGLLKQGRLSHPLAETASHLYFVNSAHYPWFGFMSTHPPLTERIQALDPQFDGAFKHILSLPSREAEYDRLYEQSVLRARAKANAEQSERLKQ